MIDTKFASWPDYGDEEREAVEKVLKSNRVNYWTGNKCREFETRFAEFTHSKYAIAVANGTLSLDVSLKALGIGPGDEVIVTPRTFIASVSSVISIGATPVFSDVCINSGNITASTIESKLTSRTKAIIPVHLAGWPCDMSSIMALATKHDLYVIEDCAQAHGSKIDGTSVGSFGHIGSWSFCQDKIMTTGGEGGMVTTNDEDLWSYMWSYKDHGKDFDAVYNREHEPGFRWLHESFGTNFRMLEMQAAIGLIQLEKMREWTARRSEIASHLINTLESFEDCVRVPLPDPEKCTHAFYRLYAYVKPEGLADGWSRDKIVAEVNALGAPLLHGTCSEVYLEKAFDGSGFRPESRLPIARELGETSLMMLTHPSMTAANVDAYCNAIQTVLHRAQK